MEVASGPELGGAGASAGAIRWPQLVQNMAEAGTDAPQLVQVVVSDTGTTFLAVGPDSVPDPAR
jgi:hypothetical protein